MNIAVIYLAWLPYGVSYLKDFLKSYSNNSSGHKHKLVFILNGIEFSEKKMIDEFKELIHAADIPDFEIIGFEKGQDIEIYQKVSEILHADYFLFLNTYSQFKKENWLKYYVQNWNEKVGLIGATGSYASYYSSIIELTKFGLKYAPVSQKFRSMKYMIKMFMFQRNKFKRFPAPHVRTNAFFISRKIFRSLEKVSVENKMQAYYFENGKSSLTMQILALGYKCLIIDKFGKSYDIPEWHKSNIFWTGNQDNLLISDNQTKKYDNSTENEKKLLRTIAWSNLNCSG